MTTNSKLSFAVAFCASLVVCWVLSTKLRTSTKFVGVKVRLFAAVIDKRIVARDNEQEDWIQFCLF